MPRSLAPRYAAYALRMGNPPGPVMGTSLRGGVFLPDVMPGGRQIIEAAFGADLTADPATWAWYDITSLVLWDPGVSIPNIGRGDERSKASPAQCSFTLKNLTGDFTPGNVGSRFFPNVKLNTPIRCSLDLGNGETLRFQGECSNGFAPRWDTSRRFAVSDVVASGIKRRIGQGNSPLKSPLVRAVLDPLPVAAWTLDDASTATQAASAVPGGSTLISSGSSVATYGAAASDLLGATAVVTIPALTKISGTAGSYSNTGFLAMRYWVSVGTNGGVATDSLKVTMNGGTLSAWTVQLWGNAAPPTGVIIHLVGAGGALWDLDTGLSGIINVDPMNGAWYETFITFEQIAAGVTCKLYVNGQLGAQQLLGGETLGVVTGATLTADYPERYSSLAFYNNPAVASAYSAGSGYTGELADARLRRLCREQSVSIEIVGTSNIPLGAQSVATFQALLDEAADADGGLLYDGRGPGYTYVCLLELLNQPADLTLSASQLMPPFKPAPGDQGHVNRYTATRKNGGSIIFEDATSVMGSGPGGVGTYESSGTFNVSTDSPYVADRAQWEVWLGTVIDPRYPTISVALHKAINALSRQTWLDTKILSRIDITDLRDTFGISADTASLILQGHGEHWNSKLWEVVANCTPAAPYHVVKLVDGTLANAVPDPDDFRLYGINSTVSGSVAPGASSMTVVTAGTSQPWTTTATYPNDFPLQILVWGQIITVTAIVGAGQTQTFTLDPVTVLYQIPDGQSVVPYLPASLGPIQVEG